MRISLYVWFVRTPISDLIIYVNVLQDEKPIEDALVVLSSEHGNFDVNEDKTNFNGRCEFVFNASRTTSQINAVITVTVSKNGYLTDQTI